MVRRSFEFVDSFDMSVVGIEDEFMCFAPIAKVGTVSGEASET